MKDLINLFNTKKYVMYIKLDLWGGTYNDNILFNQAWGTDI